MFAVYNTVLMRCGEQVLGSHLGDAVLCTKPPRHPGTRTHSPPCSCLCSSIHNTGNACAVKLLELQQAVHTVAMASKHRTTLLHLPDDLLSRCLPSDADIDTDSPSLQLCMPACKRILGVILAGRESIRPGLELHINKAGDLPVRRASLQLLCQAAPKLHKLHIHSEQAARPVVPHPVPVSVATACPQLRQFKLINVTCSKQLQQQGDAAKWEKLCGSYAQFTSTLNRLAAQMGAQIRDIQQQQDVIAAQNQAVIPVLQAQLDGFTGILYDTKHMQQCGDLLMHKFPVGACAAMSEQPASLPHLQCLVLICCTLHNGTAAFRQQLQLLPSLVESWLQYCSFERPSEPLEHATEQFATEQAEYVAAIADSVSDRVVRLRLDHLTDDCVAALMSKPYAHLQELRLLSTSICDNSLEALLQHAPHLTKICAAEFSLQQDFSHRACKWESIIMYFSINIASLARLPLSQAPKLYVRAGGGIFVNLACEQDSTVEHNVQLTVAAAAAAAHCGGIQLYRFHQRHDKVVNIRYSTPDTEQVLLATIPILSSFTGQLNLLEGVHVTKALVKAIGSHLWHCSYIDITDCTFAEGIWDGFIASLPKVTELVVASRHVTLSQLQVLCAAATHPITLQLPEDQLGHLNDDGPDEGWQEALQLSLSDAGHGFVSISHAAMYTDDDDHD